MAAVNVKHKAQRTEKTSPAVGATLLTHSDSVDLVVLARSLYIGGTGGGLLKVTTVAGETLVFSGLTAPFVLPVQVSRVWATGTDVTLVIALH